MISFRLLLSLTYEFFGVTVKKVTVNYTQSFQLQLGLLLSY